MNRNILAVGAHFDDLQLACSGTLIKHVMNSDNVTMLVVTDSEYKNPEGVMIRPAETAHKEDLKAAEIIGANLITLDYKTFYVPFDEDITKKYTI